MIGAIEHEAKAHGYSWILGVDEAGRGPLAGPVSTAAVLLNLDELQWCADVNDSKKLTAKRRERLSELVFAHAPACAVHHVDVHDVDRMNVLGASLYGMRHCAQTILDAHAVALDDVLIVVDGKQRLLQPDWHQQAIVKGDARSLAIAAASILAKVHRDAEMDLLHEMYPAYGFDTHRGYGTRRHLEALQRFGASPAHRRSFAPVAAVLARDAQR